MISLLVFLRSRKRGEERCNNQLHLSFDNMSTDIVTPLNTQKEKDSKDLSIGSTVALIGMLSASESDSHSIVKILF